MTTPLSIGTRVEKCGTVHGQDAHRDGDGAKIVGVLGQVPDDDPNPEFRGVWGYFVEWDDLPGVPVFVGGNRIRIREVAR